MDITSISSSAALDGQTPAATLASGTDGLANEQTFLKLFVAQLKNQDPLNPQDGTQFVAQLAQFSQLEQSLQMRQDLDVVKQVMQSMQQPAAGATGTHTATPPAQ